MSDIIGHWVQCDCGRKALVARVVDGWQCPACVAMSEDDYPVGSVQI